MDRKKLGEFSSVVCVKAIITGMEDMLGEQATAIALTNAGKIRGRGVARDLALGDEDQLHELAPRLDTLLGQQGTRLCIVDVVERDGNEYVARTRETICSTGEAEGSARKCTYTLGVVWGVLETLLACRLRGRHTESVLRGGTHDVFRFERL